MPYLATLMNPVLGPVASRSVMEIVLLTVYLLPPGMNITELAFQQQLESQLRPIINWLKSSPSG
jgi:hypothetical protein